MTRFTYGLGAFAIVAALVAGSTSMSAAQQVPRADSQRAQATATPAGLVPPADYVLGQGDLVSVVFWGDDKDHSAEVVVRPDGRISLPMLNDIEVSGLTVDEARARITDKAKQYLEEPFSLSVLVKDIKSRQVYITGEVERPDVYPLGGQMTVAQLIIMAGGTKEYAKKDRIAIYRVENGIDTWFKFNYKDFVDQKNSKQNINRYLKPGDIVVVP